jgi:predicted nucleic acid-binding protein
MVLGAVRCGQEFSAGVNRLLTEDLQHGQEIEGLHIENPFL